MFDPYFGMHYLVFFLVLHHLDKEERAGCFTLIFFLISYSCDCWCFLTLPRGAVGWSAVCDCGTVFPDHTHFFILSALLLTHQ